MIKRTLPRNGSAAIQPSYGSLADAGNPRCSDEKATWYGYEQEVREVRSDDPRTQASSEESVGEESLAEPRGHGLEWDPEINLESIRVHPDADDSFMETVSATVEHYAPALKTRSNGPK